MRNPTMFPILILVTVMILAWQGLSPQAGYGRDGGGTHVALRKGWVDQFEGGKLVIDDMSYTVSAKTRYFDKNGNPISRPSLRPGQFVGFVCENNSVLNDLYILEPGTGDLRPKIETTSRPEPEPRDNSGIRFENGVWRN